MKIGISVTSGFPGDNVRASARHMIERVAAAREAGLDSLFVGDHHIVPSPYFQNTPMLGRLLAEWHNKPAGALFLLPLWNPVLVAEQVATLACIHSGRFILQCGLGTGRRQFSAMGADIRFRPSAFEQSLDVLHRLWQGETVSLDGRWKFDGAVVNPLPPEPIEVWIGASAPVAIERAARIGDVWLAAPGANLSQAEMMLDTYQQALQKLGKKTPSTVAIRRDIYVAESEAEAAEMKLELADGQYRGFGLDALVIGTREAVDEQFQALGKLGFTDVIIRNLVQDQAKAIASTLRLK